MLTFSTNLITAILKGSIKVMISTWSCMNASGHCNRLRFLFLFLFVLSVDAFSQDKEDRISMLIQNTQSENDSIVFDALVELFLYYSYTDLDSAKIFLTQTQDHVEKVNSDRHRAILHSLYGIWYQPLKKFDSAMYHFNISVDYNRKIDRKLGLGDNYVLMGNMLMDLKQNDSALACFQKAESTYLEINSAYGLGNVYTNLGVFYDNNLGDYPKALEYFHLALYHGEEDSRTYPVLRLNVGNMLSKTGRFKEAKEEILVAIDLLEKTRSWKHLSKAYDLLSNIYHESGDRENEIQNIELSAEYREKIGDPEQTFKAKNDLILTYTEYELWNKAIGLLQENLQSIDSIPFSEEDSVYFAIHTHLQLALCYHMTNKTGASSRHLNSAEQYVIPYEKLRSAQYINLIDLNCRVYDKLGLYRKALSSYKKKLDLQDSLFNKENTRLISEFETKYETEKKEQEIIRLQQTSEIQSLKLQRQSNLIIIGSLLVLIIICIIFFYNRQQKIKRDKASLQLEQRFLRSQLNPHFIFNSMGAIQHYLLTESREKASDYMGLFSKLMRQILENSRKEFIQLEEEIRMLKNYLKLQKLRFRNTFNYEIIVDKALNREYDGIPPMFAQPFIENALEHGLFKKECNDLRIKFSKISTKLVELEIFDSGTGLNQELSEAKDHKSLATIITNERLEKMRMTYKTGLVFNTENVINNVKEIDGYRVSIRLPMKLIMG